MGSPREQLADLLKQARTEAGYTSHAALSKALHVSRSLVTKSESRTGPIPRDETLAAWAEATGADLAELKRLAKEARSGNPDWFVPYAAKEAAAIIVRYWSPLVVPGIGQTTAYMRALFDREGHGLSKIDELTNARLERQARVIGRAHLIVIIDEHVLHRPVGSPAIMTEQCGHLASLAERTDVALHVLPEAANMGVYGAFDIAAAEDSTLTVRMSGIEDTTRADHGLARKASVAFERMLGTALPCLDSLTQTRSAEEIWKKRL
jgi:transcriptional regulator with XRE-family HTH domain